MTNAPITDDAPAPPKDLNAKAAKGGAVTLAASLIQLALTLGSVAILARLLTPFDYGVTALVYPLIAFLTLVGDLGLSTATLQRGKLTHSQSSTVFWIGLAVACAFTAVFALLAPLAAMFYGQPAVASVMTVLGAGFLLNALKAQHEALLKRELRLKVLAINQVTALATGIGAAVFIASQGGGYWALVAMPLVQSAVAGLMAWRTSNWRPGPPSWGDGMPSMMNFGLYLTGFNVVNFLNRQLDKILIGWKFGAGSLGYYALAYRLLLLPLQTIHYPLTNVAIPVLSKLTAEPARYKKYFLTVLTTISFCICPIVAAGGLTADLLIPFFLGEQWRPAAPIFAMLAIAGTVQIITNTNGWIYASMGRTDRQFWMRVATAPIIVAGFVVGLNWGAVGVAASYAITTACLSPILIWNAVSVSPIPGRAYLAALAPTTLNTAAVALAVLVARDLTPDPWSDIAEFGLCAGVAAAAYLAVALSLFGGRDARRRMGELYGLLSPRSKA
ncbi:MAG: lipopolysaccharide biosynthesis protein [Pseudomonadota bacterium]